jgi:hypothetical protein
MTNSPIDLFSGPAQVEFRKLIIDEKIKAQLMVFLKERKKLQDLISNFINDDENELKPGIGPLLTDMSETVFQQVAKMGYKFPKEAIDNWFEEACK